ncbi:hypothetical protein GMORB2_7742 [Geosmithia morbida]|uniref:Ankyrin repeat protein n=1 Tax=Geosmithia morbida TaxID=1094350 RepID=A0A9P5D551_9HYPO|nr:uncharacterized protein GMORB2_7742 [Geosmithia morbida]KAF4122149.1 hypothetical protein GMORB2_7742 [Geosmithia morbida]
MQLPSELICAIAANLDCECDIGAFTRVNRRLYDCLDSYLYRHNAERHRRSSEGYRGSRRHLRRRRPISFNSDEDCSALVWAAAVGREQTARKAVVDACEVDAARAFLTAARCDHVAVIELILDSHKVDVNARLYHGSTVLAMAAAAGQTSVVGFMLTRDGIDVDAPVNDRVHLCPLSWAVRQGHEGIVRLLINSGAFVDTKDPNGDTPLCVATRMSHEAIVSMLVRAGADVNTRCGDGTPPLLIAARKGHDGLVRLLLASERIDIDVTDRSGATPLLVTAQQGHRTIGDMLLASGAQVDAGQVRGLTPLS